MVKELADLKGRPVDVADLGVVPKGISLSAPRKVPQVDYERIFVLDGRGELLSEYILNGDCPVEFRDFMVSIPSEGLKHGKSLYRGEYAFTPFLVDGLIFVVLSRGVPRIEDRGFIGSLLAAAKVHFRAAAAASKPEVPKPEVSKPE